MRSTRRGGGKMEEALTDSSTLGLVGRLAAVRIFTRDLARSGAFYSDILGLNACGGGVADGFILFDTGTTVTILEAVDAAEASELVGRFLGVSFFVPDLDAAYRTLCDRGVSFEAGPERQPWGGRLAHLRDPDDNILTLVQ